MCCTCLAALSDVVCGHQHPEYSQALEVFLHSIRPPMKPFVPVEPELVTSLYGKTMIDAKAGSAARGQFAVGIS